MIRDIFCGKTILFTVSSIPFLNEITAFLEKSYLFKNIFLIKNHYKTIFELIDPIYLYSILLSCSDTI